ncbi:hypothetical protein N658DRAFT_43755 [Parathielavia hyrcaniae]|uniref:Uncharacterized protein n=1 Tax=Parathielavia hyrcaniae TaxID=113614 RepID=A0AAN6Q1S6_9PEZI|nr:hypothetical protein N658DRAFT_43755 [Parathielavia hyrcaniae]
MSSCSNCSCRNPISNSNKTFRSSSKTNPSCSTISLISSYRNPISNSNKTFRSSSKTNPSCSTISLISSTSCKWATGMVISRPISGRKACRCRAIGSTPYEARGRARLRWAALRPGLGWMLTALCYPSPAWEATALCYGLLPRPRTRALLHLRRRFSGLVAAFSARVALVDVGAWLAAAPFAEGLHRVSSAGGHVVV